MDTKRIAKEILQLNTGIESIYLAGSRAVGCEFSDSDYDFFALVNGDYDYGRENIIFGSLKDSSKFNKNSLSQKFGCDIRVRGISISELNGGGQKGELTRFIPLRLLILWFPYWKHLWGKKFSISDFSLTPFSLEEQFDSITQVINHCRDEKHDLRYLAKKVIILAGLEKQLEGFDFTPDYLEIERRFSGQPNHIVHQCMAIRSGKKLDEKKFCEFLDRYILDLGNEIKQRGK